MSSPHHSWSSGTNSSIWAPHFRPFDTPWPAPSEVTQRIHADVDTEQISMMLRNLGITPSPGPSESAPTTPPALSPSTQILSLGSSSTVHTPTPTRMAEPFETPKGRLLHMPVPTLNAHERVVSWMQRQSTASPAPRADWLPCGGWPRGVAGSMWAPRPAPFSGRDVSNVARVPQERTEQALNEPVNFLRLLQPSSQPPYGLFVTRIVKNSDQQASIFLQQKLKAANSEEGRRPIVDAIVEHGFEMMTNRFGNWAVQRCLEAPCMPKERKRVADVMQCVLSTCLAVADWNRGRVIELATNCYGTHVVQKALDCAEPIRIMVVSEMLQGDLAATLMNKHASHVWTKIMELSWSDPAPPIFDYVNRAMQGRWADLARHETGSLIVQHAFENLEHSDKGDCVREVLDSIDRLATDQWGSWVVQHLLEHGTEVDRAEAVKALVEHISTLAADPQGIKVIEKAIKSGGHSAVERVARRLSEPAKSGRRPLIVDLALGATGSQLISMLLPMLAKSQWLALHDSVKGHIVTLKGSKSGSRIVWLFERMDRGKVI
ncbi:Meiotic coiled-coil protein 2 [Ceratobasidium theobromae]|uniref:Meiotic coiled-coil protein 2 n=1 Tax=Ceratobasidium theobromae TaxID=1582974 RepID=A0A5N5Q8Z7_9AGAM|nr:Meiotic coiled-coil protein 2 [Ceratobasidium theobromae]